MNKLLILFILLCSIQSIASTPDNASKVLILIDDIYAQDSDILEAVKTYTSDIRTAYGISVSIQSAKAQQNGGTAVETKKIITDNKDSLMGVIFVGDIPRALFEFPQWNDDGFRYQRWQSDFYYMDLDGEWIDTASGGIGVYGGKLYETTVQSPNFNLSKDSPNPGVVPADSFSIRFSGHLKSPVTALCSLKIVSDNGRRLKIGDRVVIDAWFSDWDIPYYGVFQFKEDSLYKIQLDYKEEYGGANLTLEKKCEGDEYYEPFSNSVWLQDDKETEGLNATYYGNIYLQDSVATEELKNDWFSGKSNGIFDSHYSKSGEVSDSFEIWVSRINPNTAGFFGNPRDLLLSYFKKVHQYYIGNYKQVKNSIFFMTPDADTTKASDRKFIDGLAYLYGRDSVEAVVADGATYTNYIQNEYYDWVSYVGHGTETTLANGLKVTSFETGLNVNPRIFHFASCSPMLSYDAYGNPTSLSVGSAHIFATSNGGFTSVGATKTSGGNQLDDLMYYAFKKDFIGNAFLSWVNQRIKKNGYKRKEDIYDWFYAEVLIGDPMQRLEPVELHTEKIQPASPTRLTPEQRKFFDIKGRPTKRDNVFQFTHPH